jgi:DNA repair exonuclease SbcCD ATPase subunit
MGKKDGKDVKSAGEKPSDAKEKVALAKRLEGKMFGLLSKPSKDDASGGKKGMRGKGGDEPPAEEKKGKAAGVKAADDSHEGKEPTPSDDDVAEDEAGAGEEDDAAKKAKEKGGEKKKPGREEKKGEGGKGEMPKESLDELRAHKEEVEELLSSIEDAYRDATLPENTYREVKGKNDKRLAEINKNIEMLGGIPDEPLKASAPEAKDAGEEYAAPSAGPGRGQGAARKAQAYEAPSDKETGKAEALIKLLEQKIEERLRDVIASASVEVTDKRLKKMESDFETFGFNTKSKLEALENELKQAKTAAEAVSKYDRQFNSMSTEIEKVKALVDSVKEAKNVMDDKLQRVNENFAEIRSIVYQREAAGKDQTVLLDKLKDTVSQIDSARILREFTARDEQIRDVNTRLERLERGSKMLTDSINKIKGLMTDIGSLENVVKASKHVGEKLEKMQEIEEKMKAGSTKLNGLYLDMKKKLDDFAEYRVKQDKLAGVGEDLVKNVEELTRRLSDYATKPDVTTIKDELRMVREEVKKAASARPAQAAAGASPETAKLKEEKEEIEAILDTIEENYMSKALSEEDYRKAKDSNIKKLAAIEKAMKGGQPAEGADGEKYTRVMLLAKLRESYETGEISKQAYDRSMKLLLRKRQ